MSEQQKSDPLVCVGVISGVHGIKGQVKIKSYTQYPADVGAYGMLLDKKGQPLFELVDIRATPKAVVANIQNIKTRNDAERLKGTELFIKKDILPQTDEDEFYYSDLTGLEVRFRNGTVYGTVKTIQNFGAGDLIEIIPTLDVQKDKAAESVFFNFTEQNFPSINIAEGYITLLPPKTMEDTQKDQDQFLKTKTEE